MLADGSQLRLNLLLDIPAVAAWIVGMVLAFRLRRREPRAALAANLAFGLLILLALVNFAFIVWWRQQQEQSSADFQQSLFLAQNIAIPIAATIAWVLLLVALFAWRQPAPSESPPTTVRVSREVVFGAFSGACIAAVIAVAFGQDAPFLSLFGTSTSLVLLAAGWGAIAGAAVAATTGLVRGGIVGGTTGIVVVFIKASLAEPKDADTVLRNYPLWLIAIGIVLGIALARGWQVLTKK